MRTTLQVVRNFCICWLLLIFLNVANCKIHVSDGQIVNTRYHSPSRRRLRSNQQEGSTILALANIQKASGTGLQPSTARALLVSCAALYGSNYPLTKLLQDSLNPAFVTTLRFVIASMFFLPSSIRGMRGESGLSKGSIELGIWCSIGFISQAIILTKTSASKAAFFCGLSVIMPPIFDFFDGFLSKVSSKRIQDEKLATTLSAEVGRSLSFVYRISRMPLIKPLLALCGAAILEWGSGMEPACLSDFSLLITPVSFAMCFWRSAQLGTRYPSEITAITGIMLSTVALVGLAWSAISMNFCCSVGGSNLPSECSKLISALCDWKVICGLLYSGIFTTAFTSYVEQRVIRVLTAAETTLIYTLEPLFATAFAAFFLKEHLTSGTVKGAVFIILACLWDTIVDFLSRTA